MVLFFAIKVTVDQHGRVQATRTPVAGKQQQQSPAIIRRVVNPDGSVSINIFFPFEHLIIYLIILHIYLFLKITM